MIKIIKKTKKAQVWISLVIYILIATTVLILVLQAGLPLLNKMKEKVLFSRTKDVMIGLDEQIREVASEGIGSQRVIPINIREGQLSVKENKLTWDITTQNKILESGTRKEFGNVVVTVNTDVSAKTVNDYFILENTYLIVNLSKIESGTLNTNEIIQSITLKETDSVITEPFTFEINDLPGTGVGEGYTELLEEGNNLGFATVVVHMNSIVDYNYDLELTLESYADFISIDIRNFKYTG